MNFLKKLFSYNGTNVEPVLSDFYLESFGKIYPNLPEIVKRYSDVMPEQPRERGIFFLNIMKEKISFSGSDTEILKEIQEMGGFLSPALNTYCKETIKRYRLRIASENNCSQYENRIFSLADTKECITNCCTQLIETIHLKTESEVQVFQNQLADFEFFLQRLDSIINTLQFLNEDDSTGQEDEDEDEEAELPEIVKQYLAQAPDNPPEKTKYLLEKLRYSIVLGGSDKDSLDVVHHLSWESISALFKCEKYYEELGIKTLSDSSDYDESQKLTFSLDETKEQIGDCCSKILESLDMNSREDITTLLYQHDYLWALASHYTDLLIEKFC